MYVSSRPAVKVRVIVNLGSTPSPYIGLVMLVIIQYYVLWNVFIPVAIGTGTRCVHVWLFVCLLCVCSGPNVPQGRSLCI